MELLGRRAWWFPSWLEWLPHLDLVGRALDVLDTVPGELADLIAERAGTFLLHRARGEVDREIR